MLNLFLDIPRSEIRKKLEIYRLSDLKYFLARKGLTFPFKEKSKILNMLIMKPKFVRELMGVLYLREGIRRGQLVKIAGKVGVVTRRTDTREAIALKVWLRKPQELEKAHVLAKAKNVKKWKIYLKKERARFEKKNLEKLRNALRSQLRQRFRKDAILGGLIIEGNRTIVLIRHTGRGAFREETRRIRYGLSTSEIVLAWDWKKLRVNSTSEGSQIVVRAFSRALGYADGFYPEDASAEVRKMLNEAQGTGKFPVGQIVRLKIKGMTWRGLKSVDARGSRLEKLLHLAPKIPIDRVEIVEWRSHGKREGFDFRSGRWIS